MLKRSRDYYNNNIDKVIENMKERYRNLSQEDKKNFKNIKKIIEKR